jgi:hypothetical protein
MMKYPVCYFQRRPVTHKKQQQELMHSGNTGVPTSKGQEEGSDVPVAVRQEKSRNISFAVGQEGGSEVARRKSSRSHSSDTLSADSTNGKSQTNKVQLRFFQSPFSECKHMSGK